jgi:hypothetical protein
MEIESGHIQFRGRDRSVHAVKAALDTVMESGVNLRLCSIPEFSQLLAAERFDHDGM